MKQFREASGDQKRRPKTVRGLTVLFIVIIIIIIIQGRNHGWKVQGDQGFGPNTWVLVAGEGRPLPL